MPAILTFDPVSGAWNCSFKYNQDALTELKARIPHASRIWKADAKHWIIDHSFIEVFKEIADTYLDGFIENKPKAPPPPPPTASNGKGTWEDFAGLCHADDLKALYRATLKRLHPDAGGDVKDAALATVLWKQLEPTIKRR